MDEAPTQDPDPSEGPEARRLAAEAEEIRRLVDAGAGSQEELRQLAERLRQHREREDAVWRAEVKPGLVKSRKGTFARSSRADAPAEPAPAAHRSSLLAGLALLGMVVVVVLLASASSILLLLVPIAALLAYAWWHGRQGASG